MFRRYLILLTALLFAASCQSEVQEAIINQEKAIDDYVSKTFEESAVTHIDGITRVLIQDFAPASAPQAEKGDSLYIYFAGYTFESGAPATCFTLDSCMVQIGKNDLIRGLDNGLTGVKAQQEVGLFFSSKYGYGTNKVGLVPENTALFFDVAVTRIIKKN